MFISVSEIIFFFDFKSESGKDCLQVHLFIHTFDKNNIRVDGKTNPFKRNIINSVGSSKT